MILARLALTFLLFISGAAAFAAPRVAVLLFEDNVDFAHTEDFTGGPDIYRDAVEGLAAELRARGIEAEVVAIPSMDLRAAAIDEFNALFIVDTFVILPEARALLEKYVDAGGLLVGISEVGRFPGHWATPWPFGHLFGLETKPVDAYGTGVSAGPPGFYQTLRDTETGADYDVGPHVSKVWATKPAGADVLAEFPRYMSRANMQEENIVHEEPLPALTVNTFGRGKAVFFAPLVTGRIRGGWTNAADSVSLLSGVLRWATNRVELADRGAGIVAGLNQFGYRPDWPKEIVLRLDAAPGTAATFRVRNDQGEIILEGVPGCWPGRLWNSDYLTLDVGSLRREGSYQVETILPELALTNVVSLRVKIDALDELAAAQVDFFRGMRCGETCHTNDPVRGGYHDASGDYAVRMWSMPHVVWGLARYVETRGSVDSLRAELGHAVDWCLRMQADDGAAYAGVRPVNEVLSPTELRPSRDPTPREVERTFSFNFTATYAAALARACGAIGADMRLRVLSAAENAFIRIAQETPSTTADIGSRLWAATELYRVTDDAVFLKSAQADASILLARQLATGPFAGNFFADEAMTTFDPYQWKVFHSIGIYMGLIQLARVNPEDAKLRRALELFTNRYLIDVAALSPYGQKASGLLPDGRGGFKPMPFSHRQSWVRDHGLNCDLLAMAVVSLDRYRDTRDERLKNLACRQVNWVLGCNPLGFCMVEGLGGGFPSVDPNIGTGVIRGGIPNGIIGRGPENLPAWGETWDSREYWLPHNAYLLAVLALADD